MIPRSPSSHGNGRDDEVGPGDGPVVATLVLDADRVRGLHLLRLDYLNVDDALLLWTSQRKRGSLGSHHPRDGSANSSSQPPAAGHVAGPRAPRVHAVGAASVSVSATATPGSASGREAVVPAVSTPAGPTVHAASSLSSTAPSVTGPGGRAAHLVSLQRAGASPPYFDPMLFARTTPSPSSTASAVAGAAVTPSSGAALSGTPPTGLKRADAAAAATPNQQGYSLGSPATYPYVTPPASAVPVQYTYGPVGAAALPPVMRHPQQYATWGPAEFAPSQGLAPVSYTHLTLPTNREV